MSYFPLVSVITPAYNASRYISDAIYSVISQTYNNWEMIIVDDCSLDSTIQVINDIAQFDARIKVFSTQINSGPAASRNLALTKATGRFICFLDSDDYWLPCKIENQLRFMLDRNISFSYTLYRAFRDSSIRPGNLISMPKTFTYHELLKNTGIACLTVMIDAEKFNGIVFPLIKHEDFALWLRLLKQDVIAHGLMEDLARYRIANGSVSSNKIKSVVWVWNIYRNVERLNIIYSSWCLLNYMINALIKRLKSYKLI